MRPFQRPRRRVLAFPSFEASTFLGGQHLPHLQVSTSQWGLFQDAISLVLNPLPFSAPFQDPYDYAGPTQIIQDNRIILKSVDKQTSFHLQL